MQGICRLSRRWHQQFCHSPSFGPHRQCVQAFVPIREYRQDRRARRPRAAAQQSPPANLDSFTQDGQSFNPFDLGLPSPAEALSQKHDNLVVHEFEQTGSDRSTRRPTEADRPLRDEAETVWEELQEVERQLKIAQQGPFGPQSPFMRQLPPDEREELLRALANEGVLRNDEEDALDLAELDRLMETAEEDKSEEKEPLAVTLHIPRAQRVLATRFNKALKDAQEAEEDIHKSLSLWKWYLRSQQKIPGFSQIVSEDVWNFLWQSQSQLGRHRHLVMLGNDMRSVEQSLDPNQVLQYIKALQACDDIAAALSTWEEAKAASISWDELMSEFYSTGVQLYVATGRPQKAQSVALSSIEAGASPAILVHVVKGWARSTAPQAASRAWSMYMKMQFLLKEGMTPELFEQVSDSLLDANRSSMALAAFKDMIAKIRGSGKNTLDSYQKALGGIVESGNPEDIETAINQVSLTMLLSLPKDYHNKFFFASWIKKLLGQQRIEAALMVVDLMYERNIRPDAMHLNGIIGAWLREKSAKSRQRAEHIANEMIQARVIQARSFVQNDKLTEFGKFYRKVMPLNEANNTHLTPERLERLVPAANAETFSLLFDYHEERHQWQDFEKLREIMLGAAKLRPNIFIANKWLAAELRSRSFSRFWTLFNGLQTEISPNLDTFAMAWQATAMQNMAKERTDLSCRQLFSRIAGWLSSRRFYQMYKQRSDARIRLHESGLYAEIIRSFCHDRDLPGTICALQGLYQKLQATPDDVSLRLITGQIARLLPRSDRQTPVTGGRRRPHMSLQADQTVLKGIADYIDMLEAKHKIDLVEGGGMDPTELEDQRSPAARKMRLDVITEFLVITMHKTKKPGDVPAQILRDVGKVMGVDVEHIDMNPELP